MLIAKLGAWLTLCALAGCALEVQFRALLVVLLQCILGLLHILLRFLHGLGGLPRHTLGGHLHLDHGVLNGRFLGRWRCVSHLRIYIYIAVLEPMDITRGMVGF